jgi:hypothetical protein
MFRKLYLTVALTFIALPALAAPQCDEPYAPEIVNGAVATQQKIDTMHDDSMAFIKASDIYQACLLKAAAAIPQFGPSANRLIDANQKEKQRIGSLFNAAVVAFKAGALNRKTASATQ